MGTRREGTGNMFHPPFLWIGIQAFVQGLVIQIPMDGPLWRVVAIKTALNLLILAGVLLGFARLRRRRSRTLRESAESR